MRGLRYANYNVNSLNQYTSRTVPGAVDVIGTANANSTVTVNDQPTYRKGEYFRGELSIGNQSSPVYQGITNLAVLKDSPNADIVTNSTGHVLLPATPETFLHDLDGNLVRDGLWTNTWNGENRLVRTESLSTVPESARARVDWTYLPDGRWIERIVSTWVSGAYVPQSTNRFVWDGQVLLGILNEDNVATLSFMRGLDLSGTMQGAGGVGGLLAVTDHSASEAHFVGNDGNGNVGLLAAAADGIESACYAYSPFGETLRATGKMAERNPMRFSTQFADDVAGDAKYLFREYRPATGRWFNRDPLEEEAALNLLNFLSNRTIDRIDVDGRQFYEPPVIPQEPRTPCERFQEWYEKEKGDMGWLKKLPDCPCSIPTRQCSGPPPTSYLPANPNPPTYTTADNPDKNTWQNPSTFHIHTGAKWCMRSKPVEGSTQQCCYDSQGKLITHGSGAGTSDRGASLMDHTVQDYLPYQWARSCDKSNGTEENVSKYLEVRPINNGNGCAKNP